MRWAARLGLLACLTAPSAVWAADVSVTDVGAVGDGSTINTKSIQSAIDQVAAAGGGTVTVPPGVYLSGTLHLKSFVELHLAAGAILKGSPSLADYQMDGQRVGLLFTQGALNVSITGQGTIDGNADSFMDMTQPKHMASYDTQYTRQKDHFREVREGLGDGPAVPHERPYQMIIFSDCRQVTVRDVLIKDSPFWTLHCADCDGVMVRGVRIWNSLLVPNNDGIDCTDCQHVLVSDCDIRTGDDALVFTGYAHHHELPGYKELHRPCENVVVSNCTLVSRSSAIRIGGWDQNPMRNMTFDNITITDSNRGIGIFLRQAGSIENLCFSNMVIQTRLHTGDWWGNGEPIHVSAAPVEKDVKVGVLRNVKFQNMVCDGQAGFVLYGTDATPIENVSFDNVSFHVSDGPLDASAGGNIDLRPVFDQKLSLFAHDIPAIYARNVRRLRLHDVDVTWGDVHEAFFTHALQTEHCQDVTLEYFSGKASPSNPQMKAISQEP